MELQEFINDFAELLVAMFDEKFEKEISGTDIRTCTTVSDLYNFAIK